MSFKDSKLKLKIEDPPQTGCSGQCTLPLSPTSLKPTSNSKTQLSKKLAGPPICPDFQFRIENCSTLTKSQSTNFSSMQEVGGRWYRELTTWVGSVDNRQCAWLWRRNSLKVWNFQEQQEEDGAYIYVIVESSLYNQLGYYLQNVFIVIATNMCNSEGYERVLKKMTSGQLGRSDRYRVRWVSPILPTWEWDTSGYKTIEINYLLAQY